MSALKIYTLVENADKTVSVLPFPDNMEQAEISDYEYSASRMGGAPVITAKIKHRRCLDNFWTEKQFVEFGGVKYFVRDTPSSTKSSDDTRYEHDITFLHERFVLENVYMIDTVSKDDKRPITDKYVSNSTKVVFWGNIEEFVARFNACLYSAGLGGNADGDGYYVVIDAGITSEDKLVSFEDKYFSEALQEIYNVFEIPYYWIGKVCHVGYAPDVIEEVFEYGADNELLKIEKQNTNEGYCNRVTGVGSSDNLPVYYPNTVAANYTYAHAVSAEDGATGNKGITKDELIRVVDENKFGNIKQASPQEKPFENYGIIYWDGAGKERLALQANYRWAWNIYTESQQRGADTWKSPCEISETGVSSVNMMWRTVALNSVTSRSYVLANGQPMEETELRSVCKELSERFKELYHTSNVYGGLYKYASFAPWVKNNICAFLGNTPPIVKNIYEFRKDDLGGNYCYIDVIIGYWINGVRQNFKSIDAVATYDRRGDFVIPELRLTRTTDIVYDDNGITVTFLVSGLSDFDGNMCYINVNAEIEKYDAWNEEDSWLPVDASVARRVYTEDIIKELWLAASDSDFIVSFNKDYRKYYSYDQVINGDVLYDCLMYYKRCEINTPNPVVRALPARWYSLSEGLNPWYQHTLADFGIRLDVDPETGQQQQPMDGDKIVRIYKEDFSRMPTQSQLMPSIYFETKGEHSFYNALNANRLEKDELYKRFKEFYKNEDGEYYNFEHEIEPDNPREGKFDFPDIKPTIKGLVNIDGKPLDHFVEVGFDDNDHDFIKGDEYGGDNDQYVSELSSDAKYEHSYFFAKLPRTVLKDREGYNFNLFDKASVNDMSVSMTSGSCGACKFKIMVEDGELKRNPVVVWREGEVDHLGVVHHAGELRKDKFGRVVLVGTSNGAGFSYQDEQQDTTKNEVWICLQKETDTYGILMPNCAANLRPKADDSYVLLDILLPVAYVMAAQDLLSQKIIAAMYEANRERFGFSVSFSRIYFAENMQVLQKISENSMIKIRYDDRIYSLYVSSYSYKSNGIDVLPEISVELSTKIGVGSPFVRQKTSGLTDERTAGMVESGGVELPYIITEGDTTEPTNDNILSARESENRYVKKDGGTITGNLDVEGRIYTQKIKADEIYVGDFKTGMTGAKQGMAMLPDGTLIARQLKIEDRLIVPSIDYNRAMILFGIFIIASASGKIKEVTPDLLRDADGNIVRQKVNADGARLYQEVNEAGVPVFNPDGTPKESVVFSDYPITTLSETGADLYGNTGTATLDLTEDEYGAVAEGDMLLGFWHNLTGNSAGSFDGHTEVDENGNTRVVRDGNLGIAGFASIYFLVESVDYENHSDGSVFRYSLRSQTDDTWTNAVHPQVGMSFYGFGNQKDESRQSVYIMTTEYNVRLVGKKEWTYSTDNIMEVHGKLDGFSMNAIGRDGKPYVKNFSGYGSVIGNGYFFGNIEQFERAPYLVNQVLYYLATDQKSGVTVDTAGWTTNVQTVSQTQPYLWQYYEQTFNNGVTEEKVKTPPFIAANYSKDGTSITIKGSVLKVFATMSEFLAAKPLLREGMYAVNDGVQTKKPILCVLDANKDYVPQTVTTGDCYINQEDGHLYSAGDTEWTDAGEIRGTSIEAQYSADAEHWHGTFETNDVWMRTRSTEGTATWGQPIRIVPEYAVVVQVFSRDGTVRIGKGKTITLYAKVFRGQDDITNIIAPNFFVWERTSADKAGDAAWNAKVEHQGKREITIGDEDIVRLAQFDCIVTYQNE